MKVRVKVPGSSGELTQGIINNKNFLISCPIDLYSSVTIEKNSDLNKIQINQNKVKTVRVIKETLAYLDQKNTGLNVTIDSKIPIAKGMGSSTADLAAAVIGVHILFNKKPDLNLIKDILINVEPTDPIFIKGIVSFDHIKGKRLSRLGYIDPIPILIFDYGGKVDTITFNKRENLNKLNKIKETEVKKAYNLICKGIKYGKSALIGKGATISSLANQQIIKKNNLEKLVKLLRRQKSFLGICNAHSGTVIGIMAKKKSDLEKLKNIVIKNFPELKFLYETQIINGGYKVLKGKEV